MKRQKVGWTALVIILTIPLSVSAFSTITCLKVLTVLLPAPAVP